MMMILKLTLVASVLAVVSCETMQVGPGPQKEATKSTARPQSIQGFECIPSPYLKVFQVLEKGILAHLCPAEYPRYYDNAFAACVVEGDTVFMEVPKKYNDFVDDQKITLGSDACFVGNGTYTYQSSDGRRRTVRNIVVVQEESKEEPKEQTKAKDDKAKAP